MLIQPVVNSLFLICHNFCLKMLLDTAEGGANLKDKAPHERFVTQITAVKIPGPGVRIR